MIRSIARKTKEKDVTFCNFVAARLAGIATLPIAIVHVRAMLVKEGGTMNHRFIPNPPGTAPITPMVYVKEKTVWQYKVVIRNLSKEEAPSEDELNNLGKDGWELTGVFADSPFTYFYFKRLKD
jgi:hypothetical protein